MVLQRVQRLALPFRNPRRLLSRRLLLRRLLSRRLLPQVAPKKPKYKLAIKNLSPIYYPSEIFIHITFNCTTPKFISHPSMFTFIHKSFYCTPKFTTTISVFASSNLLWARSVRCNLATKSANFHFLNSAIAYGMETMKYIEYLSNLLSSCWSVP